MGKKRKNKSNKLKGRVYDPGHIISRVYEHTFIPKTDHIYDEEKELYSSKNSEDNYFYEYVSVYECRGCKKKFRDYDTFSSHAVQCSATEKGYRLISHKIKRLKYQIYD